MWVPQARFGWTHATGRSNGRGGLGVQIPGYRFLLNVFQLKPRLYQWRLWPEQFSFHFPFCATQLMNCLRISCLLLLISLGWGAGGEFGPATAIASCGDYVHLGNGRGKSASATAGSLAGAFAGEQDLAGPASLPRQGSHRCQGPSCRGALPPTPLAPPLKSSPESRELLGLTASDLDRDPYIGRVPGEIEASAARQREGRWERPPRS